MNPGCRSRNRCSSSNKRLLKRQVQAHMHQLHPSQLPQQLHPSHLPGRAASSPPQRSAAMGHHRHYFGTKGRQRQARAPGDGPQRQACLLATAMLAAAAQSGPVGAA